jgi:hypothetical protein
MERFFTPTRRHEDIFELDRDIYDGGPFLDYNELELTVSVEDFLTYQWVWKDLRVFVSGDVLCTILWISEYAFLVVCLIDGNNFDTRTISNCSIEAEFQETSGQTQTLDLASIAHADIPLSTREVDVFWHAIMTSNSVKLNIQSNDLLGQPSGHVLSQFLQGSTSLHELVFRGFNFKEEHCRALMKMQRTDLDIRICQCTLEPQNVVDTFIEWFRRNQVVTALDRCRMESGIFSALSGNNSVKRLVIEKHPNEFGKEEMRSLLQALPGNMGIEYLNFINFEMNDKPWSLLFRSLSTHPQLKSLSISNSNLSRRSYSAGAKSTVMNAILQMLQHNTVVHSIRLPDAYNDEAVYHNAILPRLEMNRTSFEVQRQAVKRADPSIRSQLLGRALHVVQYNSDLVFQFLSENVPCVCSYGRSSSHPSSLTIENDAI